MQGKGHRRERQDLLDLRRQAPFEGLPEQGRQEHDQGDRGQAYITTLLLRHRENLSGSQGQADASDLSSTQRVHRKEDVSSQDRGTQLFQRTLRVGS